MNVSLAEIPGLGDEEERVSSQSWLLVAARNIPFLDHRQECSSLFS